MAVLRRVERRHLGHTRRARRLRCRAEALTPLSGAGGLLTQNSSGVIGKAPSLAAMAEASARIPLNMLEGWKMTLYRSLLAAILAVALFGAVPAAAAEWKDFDAASFAEAQKQGKSILVDIFAPWCPTCRAQNPILVQLTREPKYKNLVVFKVDFDTQQADVRALKATSQSTLIAYKGNVETGRSAGDTSPPSIEALLDSTL
jgi:thiol-disulfide isomerase/thioredoxin